MNNMKDRIIKGASDLFFKHGFSKITVDYIAEYLGISKKTIYNHFENKMEVIKSVQEYKMQSVSTELDSIANNNEIDFMEKLKQILAFAYRETANQHMFLQTDANRLPMDMLMLPMNYLREKILSISKKLSKEGIDKKMIRPDVPRDFIPYFYLSIVEGSIQLYRFADLGIKKDELFTESIKLTLFGMLTEEGREKFST